MSRNALLRASVRNRSVRRASPTTVLAIGRHRLIALGVYLAAIAILLVACPRARAADLRPLEETTLALLAVAAVAETSRSGEPVATARSDTSNAPESAPAIEVAAFYTADWRRNTSGGLRRGARHLDNLDLTLAIDAERAFGWRGTTLFAHGLYNNGQTLSEDLVGDLQGVSNIETGVEAVRLYEAWIEQRFAADRASVKVGLYDLNSEFDTIEAAGLFLNSSHGIGHDFSQSGRNGPSIFPVTSLAIRVDYRIDDHWLVRAAVLDGVPGDPEHPARTTIRLGGRDGALVIGEIVYADDDTRIALGHWRYTATFDDVLATEADGRPVGRDDNAGTYLLTERRLTREADGAQGLSGWLRLGLAEERINPVDRYLGAGLVYVGPFAGRDADQIGLAIGWVGFGEPYRRAAAVGDAPDSREVSIEASYRAPITAWLTLQPDVQYVIDPGGDPALDDALVLGLRAEIGF